MGATYTRQSSSAIVDGGIIEAADINAEFNQILAAFAESSGHTHDGTAAEGGPITKLLGTAITIGDATAGTDIAVTFDGETADGVLTWMEDEDYFQFSDDLLLTTTEKLQFRDTAIYINSSADGQLDLVADTEIQIAATTVDINGNVDVSGTLTVGGALDFSDANITNIGSIALDTITGIWKSVNKGESISSRRFSAFISKTMLYESTIMLFFLMDKFIINDIVIQLFSVPHLTTKAVGLVLISVELISINENYKGITGTDLWQSAKNLLFRIKEVRKDIKDLK